MKVKYTLVENKLTQRPNDFKAQVQGPRSYDLDAIVEDMVKRGSTVTKADVLAVLHAFFECVMRIIRSGGVINTDLFKTQFSISGRFKGRSDRFDPKRHRLRVLFLPGKMILKALGLLKTQKVAAPTNAPHITSVKDAASGSTNAQITSGSALEIAGYRLKVVGTHADNGVYFVDSENEAHPAAALVNNQPKNLIVVAPTLPPGTYTLEVKTQYSTGVCIAVASHRLFFAPYGCISALFRLHM